MFTSFLGHRQYYPEVADAVPKNRLFGRFHAPLTEEMKEEILCQLTSSNSTIRVVFANVAMGMGVDVLSIRPVIDIGLPHTIINNIIRRQEAQDMMGNHARQSCTTITGISQETKQVCKIWYETFVALCLRSLLLQCMEASDPKSVKPFQGCCSECLLMCLCTICIKQKLQN